MADKAPQNTPNKGRFVKGDPRINKGGRPKNEVSLTAIARRYLSMTPAAIAEELDALRARYAKIGKGSATLGEYIMGAFLYALANDPQPGNMRELWRRIDGEVSQTVFDVDPATLTDEELERIRNGESIESVLADARRARTRVQAANNAEATDDD